MGALGQQVWSSLFSLKERRCGVTRKDCGNHLLLRECDPEKCPEETNRESRGVLPLRHALWRHIREKGRQEAAFFSDVQREGPPIGGAIRASCGRFGNVGREPAITRLGGCAGSLEPTYLSLQFGGNAGVIFANCRDSAVLSQQKAWRGSMSEVHSEADISRIADPATFNECRA
jgi:hypothetical protein